MTDHTTTPVGRLATWLDERTGLAKFVRSQLDYVFPKHFSFLFGEIALYSFVVLVATGVFLALFYSPGEAEVAYQGTYAPLHGVSMTEAYRSVVELSFDVRVGLLVRQTHHWAALVFLGAIMVHLARVFFTGAFRKPRELQWVTGVTLLVVAIVEGFAGYSLLDDLLSGTGLRIANAIVLSVPVVGEWLGFLLWGGEYPGEGFLARLFAVHIFLLPMLIAGLIGVHLALVARQKHTQFPGPGRREGNVVGLRLWPTYAAESAGLFFVIAGALVAMGGLLQINPVWLYGPYDVFAVSSGSQADWYVLWTQGALRLMPAGFQWQIAGVTFANQFFAGVLFPGLLFTGLYAYPWLEAAVSGDRRPHHLLERPRDRPVRTGVGAGAITGLVVLLVAGTDDVLAAAFDWSIVALRNVERAALFLLPPLVGWYTARVCRDLQAGDLQDGDLQDGDLQAGERGRSRDPAPDPTSAAEPGTGGVAERSDAGRRLPPELVRAGMAVTVAGVLWRRVRRKD